MTEKELSKIINEQIELFEMKQPVKKDVNLNMVKNMKVNDVANAEKDKDKARAMYGTNSRITIEKRAKVKEEEAKLQKIKALEKAKEEQIANTSYEMVTLDDEISDFLSECDNSLIESNEFLSEDDVKQAIKFFNYVKPEHEMELGKKLVEYVIYYDAISESDFPKNSRLKVYLEALPPQNANPAELAKEKEQQRYDQLQNNISKKETNINNAKVINKENAEANNQTIDNSGYDRQKQMLDQEKERLKQQHDQKIEQIEDQKRQLEQNKQNQLNQMKNKMNPQSVQESIGLAANLRRNSMNGTGSIFRNDIMYNNSNFNNVAQSSVQHNTVSEMLYSGFTGKLIKYLETDQVPDDFDDYLETAKKIKNDPFVQEKVRAIRREMLNLNPNYETVRTLKAQIRTAYNNEA